jgi:hypothetical protein
MAKLYGLNALAIYLSFANLETILVSIIKKCWIMNLKNKYEY